MRARGAGGELASCNLARGTEVTELAFGNNFQSLHTPPVKLASSLQLDITSGVKMLPQ